VSHAQAEAGDSPQSPGAEPPVDYLDYLRSTRRAFGAAILSSLFFLILYGVRILSAFRSSPTDGTNSLVSLAVGLCGALVLLMLFMIGWWIPAALRAAVLKRALPDATFYVVKRIPYFWERLAAVHFGYSTVPRLRDPILSIDGASATLWLGVLRPTQLADLPMTELVRIESDRRTGTPFRRRLIVLTFDIAGTRHELPLALRTVPSIGLGRLSASNLKQLIVRLDALSERPSP
jgi:hypothetical protein